MKILRTGLYAIAVCLVLSACGSTRKATVVDAGINGNWVLQTVNLEGIQQKFSPKVFNEADLNCFVGSNWNFVSTSHAGSYKIIGGPAGCATMQRNIQWSVNRLVDTAAEISIQRLDQQNKPMSEEPAFRLIVSQPDKKTMQLKSAITFEGKPGNIVYNFVKQD